MSIISHITARRVRNTLVSAAVAGAGLAGALGMGGVAHAAPTGYVTVMSCTTVAGQINYSPGLLKSKARTNQAVFTGTTSGCSSIYSGPMAGTGSFTAILSGKASLAAANFGGSFTINWPASSGLNPSVGTLSVTEAHGVESVSGTITGGASTGSVIQLGYLTTLNTGTGTAAHPVTAQQFVNTQSLTVAHNNG